MKKYNLFKVLGITIFIAWLLTLFIPGSYLDYSGNVVKDSISGVGIWALLSNTSISISYFNSIAIFLIAVAVFYSILAKTNVYNNFVQKVSSVFENKKRCLVSLVTIIFGILSIFVSNSLILIVFVPFVYNVMKKLDIDKKVILSSTIIASIIGSMSQLYNALLFNAFNLKLNTLLLVKIILLVISLFVLIIFIAPKKEKIKTEKKTDKKSSGKVNDKKVSMSEKKKVSEKIISKEEKKVNKIVYAVLTILFGTLGVNKFYAGKIKQGIICLLFCWTLIPTILSIAEFITVLTLKADKEGKINVDSNRISNVKFGVSITIFALFVIGAIIPWESLITNCTVFSDFNKWVSELKIGSYSIFNNIIGAPVVIDSTTGSSAGVIAAFGSWTMVDISILLIILSVIIALVSNVKFDEFIEYSNKGIKKVLPVAITAMLISIVLVIMVTTGVNITITNWILSLTKGFNIATSTLAAVIGSITTGDFYYFASSLSPVYKSVVTNSDYYGVVSFIVQSIFNLMMVIGPTSVGLIIGLYYLDISYSKWIKYIWKALLGILAVVLIIAIVIFALV